MALREVNMIPDDFLFGQNLFRHLGLWTITLIISIALISGFHFYHNRKDRFKKPPVGKIRDTQEQLKFKIEEINLLQEELTRLEQKKSGLEKTVWNPVYSRVLLKLSAIMSHHMWIIRLNLENDKAATNESRLSLKGYTLNSAELGDFLKSLTDNTLFHDVSLTYAREAVITESDHQANDLSGLIEFQIECRINA